MKHLTALLALTAAILTLTAPRCRRGGWWRCGRCGTENGEGTTRSGRCGAS